MKLFFGPAVVLAFVMAMPSVMCAQIQTVPVERTDDNTVQGFAYSAGWCGRHTFGKFGGFQMIDQDNDINFGTVATETLFHMSATSLATGPGANATSQVGGDAWAFPIPNQFALTSEITMVLNTDGFASAIAPAAAGVSMDGDMDLHTMHKVSNFGSDNNFTLEAELYIHMGGPGIVELGQSYARTAVASNEAEAEYQGNNIFFVTGWLRNDYEAGNGGVAGQVQQINMVKTGEVNEFFIGTQLVHNNGVFGMLNVVESATGLLFNFNGEPAGGGGIDWQINTLASFTVRDLE